MKKRVCLLALALFTASLRGQDALPEFLPDRPKIDAERDCAVVAAEYYARLKTSVPWARIVHIWCADKITGERIVNHAMVAFKYHRKGGRVWLVDRTGAYDLDTTHTDIGSIRGALPALYAKVSGRPVTEIRERLKAGAEFISD